MTFNQEMHNSLMRHFLEKKMPWDMANAAACVVASEHPNSKHQRTAVQQKAVDIATAWMSHPNPVNKSENYGMRH